MAHQEYSSPDGILTLVVSDEDGNSAIGFKGFRWHTHGDVLAATYPVVDGTRLMPNVLRNVLSRTSSVIVRSSRF
jgi:hypothetical protein